MRFFRHEFSTLNALVRWNRRKNRMTGDLAFLIYWRLSGRFPVIWSVRFVATRCNVLLEFYWLGTFCSIFSLFVLYLAYWEPFVLYLAHVSINRYTVDPKATGCRLAMPLIIYTIMRLVNDVKCKTLMILNVNVKM